MLDTVWQIPKGKQLLTHSEKLVSIMQNMKAHIRLRSSSILSRPLLGCIRVFFFFGKIEVQTLQINMKRNYNILTHSVCEWYAGLSIITLMLS